MDIAALVISIVSIIISIIVIVYDKAVDKRLNRITMSSSYFNDLYKDILILKIPEAREKISFTTQGKLVGSDALVGILNDIINKSLYFFYTDKDFYNQLKKKTQDLEDYLLQAEDKTIHGEAQTAVFNEIANKISELYNLMNKKFLHGKSR